MAKESTLWRRLARLRRRRPSQHRSRALAKTAGYRGLMVILTVLVAFAVTSEVSQALEIGLIANVAKTGTYYAYERLWDRIDWGQRATAGASP